MRAFLSSLVFFTSKPAFLRQFYYSFGGGETVFLAMIPYGLTLRMSSRSFFEVMSSRTGEHLGAGLAVSASGSERRYTHDERVVDRAVTACTANRLVYGTYDLIVVSTCAVRSQNRDAYSPSFHVQVNETGISPFGSSLFTLHEKYDNLAPDGS